MKKKIVELELDKNIEMPLSVVSFVEHPAIEENYMMFSRIEEKQEIIGIALKANKMIVRLDKNNEPYYVYFIKDVVKEACDAFNNSLNKKINFNIEHNPNDVVTNVDVISSYVVNDEQIDEANTKFSLGAENGDWILHVKINDKNIWELLKQNTNGFSIEVSTQTFNKAIQAANEEKYKEFLDNDIADFLLALGEDVDMEEYDLISDEYICENDNFTAIVSSTNNTKSAQNNGLYKILFRYTGDLKDNSREFCKKMIKANKLYSKENIDKASEMGVNGEFAHLGGKYDIFKYSAGVNCNHKWVKEVYFRKRNSNGKFLPNDKLNNDRLLDKSEVIKIGIENDLPDETVAPINMPNRGAYNG